MTSHLLLPGALVCVPESQRSEYEARLAKDFGELAQQADSAASPSALGRCRITSLAKIATHQAFAGAMRPRVITHPDEVKGLTPKLNWCLEQFAGEDAIVFVDDDITSVQRTFTEIGEESLIRDPALIREIIEATHQIAKDLDIYYFGWEASNGAIRYHDGLKPFQLTGYINGCAMGFRRGHGLRFDPRIVAKNDFDIAAMNAYKHRTCFRNNRYLFAQKGTFVGKGGQAAHRNSETERRDVELLRRKWGGIFHYGGHSGTRKRDYAGVQKITMHLPF